MPGFNSSKSTSISYTPCFRFCTSEFFEMKCFFLKLKSEKSGFNQVLRSVLTGTGYHFFFFAATKFLAFVFVPTTLSDGVLSGFVSFRVTVLIYLILLCDYLLSFFVCVLFLVDSQQRLVVFVEPTDNIRVYATVTLM